MRNLRCLDAEVVGYIISSIAIKDGTDDGDLSSLTTSETSRFSWRKGSKNRTKLKKVTDCINSCGIPFSQIEILKKMLKTPLL